MDKTFFENLPQREKDYASRNGLDRAGAEIVLHNTRAYAITNIVELSDAWLHFDAEDIADDNKAVSLVLPYHQISYVRFREPRRKQGQAGFGR